MLILALDAALARCAVCLVRDGEPLRQRIADGARGHAARLAPMADAVLAEAGVAATSLDAIAVTVGPGSFTGLRAALALGHGIALAAGCEIVGVTVGEAMAEAFPAPGARKLWTAIDSRRGRAFLDRGPDGTGADRIAACDLAASDLAASDLAAWARPEGPVAIAGDAAIAVAATLAAADHDVALTDLRLPLPHHIARAAARRLAGALPPRPAQPLYIDPPEARLPAGGLRPPPAPAQERSLGH
jgi:tRNA threonylcarbamoyl adenosine modification protein YeaZ